MSLLSTVMVLTSDDSVPPESEFGRATHAWFLKQVRERDPALAAELHRENREKPFTVSGLWKRRNGKTFLLRLTSYEPTLTTFLLEELLPGLPEEVSLAGVSFRVAEVITDPSQTEERGIRPWVGRTSFEDLLKQNALRPRIPAGVKLRFASPTVFRSRGSFMPVPLPRLVFEGLTRKWNDRSPVVLPVEVVEYAGQSVVISSYRLRTRVVRFGEGQAVPGFVGTCSYAMVAGDPYWMGMIHTLAAFAMYAGVGKQTTMGMGQTRRVER
jgi:CRISPR-associated endoribonuclease Cas6